MKWKNASVVELVMPVMVQVVLGSGIGIENGAGEAKPLSEATWGQGMGTRSLSSAFLLGEGWVVGCGWA